MLDVTVLVDKLRSMIARWLRITAPCEHEPLAYSYHYASPDGDHAFPTFIASYHSTGPNNFYMIEGVRGSFDVHVCRKCRLVYSGQVTKDPEVVV